MYMCANTEKRQSIEQPLLFHPDEEKHCGKCHREYSLYVQMLSVQQQQSWFPVYPESNLAMWTCNFPSVLLNVKRVADAWSYFWGSLPSLAHPWLEEAMPQSTTDPFWGTVLQPQLNQPSALLVCMWGKAPCGVWTASQRIPSYPGVEPKALEGACFGRGGEHARETALPRLCSLGQDPHILAPLCLF